MTAPRSQAAAALAAVSLFVAVDLATFVAAGTAARALGFVFHQWIALFSVVCATAFAIRVVDRGRWDLGLFVPLPVVGRDLLRGAVFASLLILIADAMILLSSPARVTRGDGFPWFELAMVFFPAALHEELAFRGYVYQKLRVWNRGAAIVMTAAVFALLHLGNRGISAVALVNIVLAGVLLALAYERDCRLWFPIGIHFVWNVLSGPILGFGVSGFTAESTLIRTAAAGPAWLTGGAFGIEGSVWMAVVETGGIWWLVSRLRSSNSRLEGPERA